MILRRNILPRTSAHQRRGAAAVECALVAPILILAVVGAIEVGRFVNVSQTVNDASREGARQASRDSTTQVSEIESAVLSYISDAYPNVSESALDSALTVTVRDSSGTEIAGGDLTTIPSGDPLTIDVVFQYDAVRWLECFSALGIGLETETTMRRE